MSSHTGWFDETGIDDIPEVGGKNASLGERKLTRQRQGDNA